MITSKKNERGAALIETAITIPIIMLVCVGIFEFGRAYQTWQVLTNAAREGARISILAGKTNDDVEAAVRKYMEIGGLPLAYDTTVKLVQERNITLGANNASKITVLYPYSFMMLNPIVRMVTPGSKTGEPITMGANAVMRNEN